tara:strand:+ start:175 stop:942 length:768 start_codon:yes stop_codon:yes gene_type:complete
VPGGIATTSRFWKEYDSLSDRFVDHRAWGYLLNKHVRLGMDGINRVAYGDFTPEDRRYLDFYIKSLADFSYETLNRKEQYAYWLNLYNALVIKLILSRYLVLSINDIKFGSDLFRTSPFNKTLVRIKGVPLSLANIRNDILSNLFVDPRLHYGLCDAAIGSPKLLKYPFTGDRVDRMLDGAALDFVNHPRGVLIKEDIIKLSGLYRRYFEDFGRNRVELLRHVKGYAMYNLKAKLDEKMPIIYKFDWSLNDGTGL